MNAKKQASRDEQRGLDNLNNASTFDRVKANWEWGIANRERVRNIAIPVCKRTRARRKQERKEQQITYALSI